MESLNCGHCGALVIPVVTDSGPHRRADCPICGLYIKFLPQPMTRERAAGMKLFFGKYKGKTIEEVASIPNGRGYLRWLVATDDINEKVKEAAAAYLGIEMAGGDA